MATDQTDSSNCVCNCPEIQFPAIIGSIVAGLVILGIVNVIIWYLVFKRKILSNEKTSNLSNTESTVIAPEDSSLVTFSKELDTANINKKCTSTPVTRTPNQSKKMSNNIKNDDDNNETIEEPARSNSQVKQTILANIPEDKKAAIQALAAALPKIENQQVTENEVLVPSLSASVESFQTTFCDNDNNETEPVYNEIDYSTIQVEDLYNDVQ